MNRREFIAGLGAVVASSALTQAQQQGKIPTIGFLGALTPAIESQRVAAFVMRLRELGWVDGRTVAIEYRWAEGRSDRVAAIAAELVRQGVDVVVTAGTPAVSAAKQATSIIPIVFAVAGDPVGNGLVDSLARPGGNITGLSSQLADLSPKRIGLLREAVPHIRKLAIMANAGNPAAVLEMREVQETAGKLGLDTVMLKIQQAADVASAIEGLDSRSDALYVSTDPLVLTNRVQLNILALSARLPTMYGARENVEAGGLMSYGPNIPDQFRRAAGFVDKILRGMKPAEIPVEQPTRFELIINSTTAKALGLTIPETLLATADEVIQ
jgi:putative ABC transport system substrate-binding protein